MAPDKKCKFNDFESSIKDVKNQCADPNKIGSFSFCSKLLKDSYDVGILCQTGKPMVKLKDTV